MQIDHFYLMNWDQGGGTHLLGGLIWVPRWRQARAVRPYAAHWKPYSLPPRTPYSKSSFSPSSRSAVFVSSMDCLDTPPSGATSMATVSRRLFVVANRDKTFV